MKDIYLNMNNQNILKYYGTRLDAKLDSSEYYDYELSKVVGDYNSDVLDLSTPITYTGLTSETHYFKIGGYNNPQFIPTPLTGLTEAQIISGFSTTIIECERKLDDLTNCCPTPLKLGNKPWAYKFNTGGGNDLCSPIVKRRTETGWSLDFIFNRNYLPWSSGGIFYYLGVRGENDLSKYADNNLSFGFTSNGKIKWSAVHYSGVC